MKTGYWKICVFINTLEVNCFFLIKNSTQIHNSYFTQDFLPGNLMSPIFKKHGQI